MLTRSSEQASPAERFLYTSSAVAVTGTTLRTTPTAGNHSVGKRPRVSRWPSMLVGDLDAQKIHNAGFELYARAEPETVSGIGAVAYLFVIDWAHGHAFFYSTLT